MTWSAGQILDFHRRLVATPSPSHQEGAIATLVEGELRAAGAEVRRLGDNVLARAGSGPRLLLNSHLDTVAATPQWTRDPWTPAREDGRVYGLGANDAKAAVAAMVAAFAGVVERGGPCDVALLLVPEEETGGKGTEVAWPALRAGGFAPEGVVIGEPTGLDVAIAQKGLLILELSSEGDACHAANAAALGARNPIRGLARDVVALDGVDLGPEHPLLGRTTLEPTVLSAGERRNQVPGRAACWLDLRTVPGVPHEELAARVRAAVAGPVRVHSDRLRPRECPSDAPIVAAARAARPAARLYGSRTMSDLVFFDGVPALKCGPGRSERSHTPDEWVLESEILDGAAFYETLIARFAETAVRVVPGPGES